MTFCQGQPPNPNVWVSTTFELPVVWASKIWPHFVDLAGRSPVYSLLTPGAFLPALTRPLVASFLFISLGVLLPQTTGGGVSTKSAVDCSFLFWGSAMPPIFLLVASQRMARSG